MANQNQCGSGRVTIGEKDPAFILGPCVIESEKFVWRMAKEDRLKSVPPKMSISFLRFIRHGEPNSVRSFRGIGVREGCEISFSAIGSDLKIPVTSDVHSPNEAAIAAKDQYAAKSQRFSAGKLICFAPRRKRLARSC